MSSRPGIVVSVKRPADGGESPNGYVPQITAEVRVFWPPRATLGQVLVALDAAYRDAITNVLAKREER